MFKKTWTGEEIAALARHEVPPGRSLNAARVKASELGIPFRPSDPDAAPSEPPEVSPKVSSWEPDDIRALLDRTIPEGRTLKAAYGKAHRLGIHFNRIRKEKVPQKELVARNMDRIVQMLPELGIRGTSRALGISFSSIRKVAQSLTR